MQQQPSAQILPGHWSSNWPALRVWHKLPEDLPTKILKRDEGPPVEHRGGGRDRRALSALWWEPLWRWRQSYRGLTNRAQRYGFRLIRMACKNWVAGHGVWGSRWRAAGAKLKCMSFTLLCADFGWFQLKELEWQYFTWTKSTDCCRRLLFWD